MEKILDTEIVDEEFNAPVLQNSKQLTTLINVDTLIEQYQELSDIDLNQPVEVIAEKFLDIEKGFKAFRKARTNLESKRKEIGDPAFRFHKKVIEIAKEIQNKINPYEDRLKALKDKVENEEKRKQLEAEMEEEKRINDIKNKIIAIKGLPLNHFNSDSETLTKVLESLHSIKKDEFEEFYDEAYQAQETIISQLQQARETRVKAEQADKLLAEQEKQREEEEAERKKEADKERAEFEAEKAEMQKQRDDFEREKREAQEVIDLKNAEIEAEKLEKEQSEKAEQQKQEQAKKESLKAEQIKELYDIVEAQIEMFKTPRDILNAIIDEKIDHIRWEA